MKYKVKVDKENINDIKNAEILYRLKNVIKEDVKKENINRN